MLKGQREKPKEFPEFITCPTEMVALSMADGFSRLTGRAQAVIVHVDVGTQGLGPAVHNASCGRAPVLIFAGSSPYSLEGEMHGSRDEFQHWLQDIPDQGQIVSRYCRYSGEIKSGKNIKQVVKRALQFANSDPQGPVYLCAARETMEEEINPYNTISMNAVGPSALPDHAINQIASDLVEAMDPLVIVGNIGRFPPATEALVELADLIGGMHVLDAGGSDMSFPANHPASLGTRYGVHEAIQTAKTILVLDCSVPWIPTRCKPSGLGWSGGAALGIKLASNQLGQDSKFVCQIVGDGAYMFTMPASVYWISNRYQLPMLTIVLNNGGWMAPRRSLLMVHPDGAGRDATADELKISFQPTPDYAGIAKLLPVGICGRAVHQPSRS
ncbi:Thiamine pyrophosphate enzyme [Aspergillus sp. HF37]|nr:Thiamine pyrophosphate enzyme [Aspergillus sp. HF37]